MSVKPLCGTPLISADEQGNLLALNEDLASFFLWVHGKRAQYFKGWLEAIFRAASTYFLRWEIMKDEELLLRASP